MPRLLLYGFALAAFANLWAEYQQTEWLILCSKPLLLTFLSSWFYLHLRPLIYKYEKWVLAGLIFSIGGDTLLMFVEHGPQQEHFFLLGLGSFLLAQLCYLSAFLSYPEAKKSGSIIRRPALTFPFLLYLTGLLYLLWPGIGQALRIPVSVYALAIVSMAIAAFNLKTLLSSTVWRMLIAGVVLFVLSDSLIAINKFLQPLTLARISIMATYLLGQYWIALATSKLREGI